MRKTTLEMKSLQARRRNSDDLLGCPMIQEHSLLEHFYAYVQSIPENGLKDDDSELYLRVANIQCSGSYVFVTIESGIFGDNGKVYDVETGVMKYPKNYSDSMTTSSRVVMYLPPMASTAMFAVEKVGDSRGFFLLNSFVAAMHQRDDSFIYRTGNIYEADDWAETSKLVKIEVTAYKKTLSHRGGLEDSPIVANLSQELTPPKGEHAFVDWFKKKILNRQIDVVSLFDVSEDLDKKSSIILEKDGRQKKIELGKTGSPLFREVLTDNGDLPLDDDKFLQKTAEAAASRSRQLGLAWSAAYEKGEWNADALAFRWNS